MGKYVATVKVGRHEIKKGYEIGLIRLPAKMKDKIGKWAHIIQESEDEIRIVFTDEKDIDVQEYVQRETVGELEKRVERIERALEEMRKELIGKRVYEESAMEKKSMRPPGFEPGLEAREAPVLPLDYDRPLTLSLELFC